MCSNNNNNNKNLFDLQTTVHYNSTQLHFFLRYCFHFSPRKRNFTLKDPQHKQLIPKNHAICASITFFFFTSVETKAKIELRLRYDHTVVDSHITIIDRSLEQNFCFSFFIHSFQFFIQLQNEQEKKM